MRCRNESHKTGSLFNSVKSALKSLTLEVKNLLAGDTQREDENHKQYLSKDLFSCIQCGSYLPIYSNEKRRVKRCILQILPVARDRPEYDLKGVHAHLSRKCISPGDHCSFLSCFLSSDDLDLGRSAIIGATMFT